MVLVFCESKYLKKANGARLFSIQIILVHYKSPMMPDIQISHLSEAGLPGIKDGRIAGSANAFQIIIHHLHCTAIFCYLDQVGAPSLVN